MALDRQSIEKRDFPIGRRGYDPEAVDAHLTEVAAEVEELKLSAHRRTETLASSASEQVRSIVEAAESSAREIQAQAETEARAMRSEAADESSSARSDATMAAREHVSRVSEATASMLARLDAMESELGVLIDSLRTGANRLNADLQLLEANFEEVSGSVLPAAVFVPEPGASNASPADQIVDDFEDADSVGLASAEDDTEDARLVALNMALDGTSREETAKYLDENFQIADTATLLDEVYSSVGA